MPKLKGKVEKKGKSSSMVDKGGIILNGGMLEQGVHDPVVPVFCGTAKLG